jgi:phasin family protein
MEQIVAGNTAGVEILLGIANTQFAAFEHLSALNFNATKAAFDAGVRQTKALLGAKDVHELASLYSAVAQPNMDNAIACSRGVYDLATHTQSEITKLMESQAVEFNKNIVEFLDNISKTAAAGSDIVVAAMKSALAAANSARARGAKIAKQATEMAEANFTAATNAPQEAKNKAA